MTLTNKLGLPEAFVLACETGKHNAPGAISATTLLKGVKEIVLAERHWDEIEADVSDQIWAIFGTAVYSVLERETPDSFVEERLSVDVGGMTVSGRVDNYNMKTATIEDYKTASAWKVIYRDFDDWYKQGMIYAWLMRQSGLPVDRVRFIALLKDFSKSKAKREADYPKSPVYVYQFTPTETGYRDIEVFIRDKVEQIVYNSVIPDDGIVPCSADERWAKDTRWAVMKAGRKSAVKLHDTEDSAMAHADETGGYVEKREGESTKCLEYCPCAEFCDFSKSLKEAN